MQTVSDNLRAMAATIRALLQRLLDHTEVYRWNEPGSGFISGAGDYEFRPLGEEGRQLQAHLLETYRHFHALLQVLLQAQPADTIRELEKTDRLIRATIEQQRTWITSTEAVFQETAAALDTQVALLMRLYDQAAGTVTFVPDTNALYYNPALDTWRFPAAPQFWLILTPTVLAELDDHKDHHRNDAVRAKAERLVHQFKDYRRRGTLVDGVVLAKGVSHIQAVAVEPHLDQSLPWLDPHNNDDRILASVIEVMRRRPHSPVILISRDVNLQTKAEFARLPFEEPPRP